MFTPAPCDAGAENLGPMLYSLVRFAKPARVLEVGAGYTSVFLLQALADNAAELEVGPSFTRVSRTTTTINDYFTQPTQIFL